MAPEPVAAAHLRAARWVSGQRGGAQAAREGTRRQVIGLGGGRPYGCPGPAPEAPASRLSSLRHGRPPLRHLRRAPDHKRGLHLRQRYEENRLLRPADSIEAAEAPSAALSCASRVDDTQEQLGRRAGWAGGERIRPQRHGSPPSAGPALSTVRSGAIGPAGPHSAEWCALRSRATVTSVVRQLC